MSKTTLVWFRQDLRLADHPAWVAAVQSGGVIPVYIWDPRSEEAWRPGAASRWWLHHSLTALDKQLRGLGSRLILRKGPTHKVLRELIKSTQATSLYWTRRYEPSAIKRDTVLKQQIASEGVDVQSFNGTLLFEPWTLKTQAGKPYQVFTPFWNACLQNPNPLPVVVTKERPQSPKTWPASDSLESWDLLPKLSWSDGFFAEWTPGEMGAARRLRMFVGKPLSAYSEDRNRPDYDGSSQLSPHLHFGEISPRQIWHAVKQHAVRQREQGWLRGAEVYLREIGWREFAFHLLYHFPHTPEEPLHTEFKKFPWQKNQTALKRWQKGLTGYPIVDAGMRQLWATGWMHNRVRMIVGSFLVKDLMLPWQEGARWFWDTLVDADLANNTLGWQWIAGCGADAAPYYRVFNPVLQGEKFDPQGDYVRRWVPELKNMSADIIHKPWTATALPSEYPTPLIDHAVARSHALAAYKGLK